MKTTAIIITTIIFACVNSANAQTRASAIENHLSGFTLNMSESQARLACRSAGSIWLEVSAQRICVPSDNFMPNAYATMIVLWLRNNSVHTIDIVSDYRQAATAVLEFTNFTRFLAERYNAPTANVVPSNPMCRHPTQCLLRGDVWDFGVYTGSPTELVHGVRVHLGVHQGVVRLIHRLTNRGYKFSAPRITIPNSR